MVKVSCGLIFPGQGSQFVGMGADLYDRFPESRAVYDRACDVLEFDIREISFQGPEDRLRSTRYTQPAILVHSMAVLAALPALEPPAVAGHSLGEYSALYAAGALDFESVLKLVRRRAELMAAEGEKNPGTMAAIIGADAEKVGELCSRIEGIVVPANFNEPLQTVISGEVEAVRRAVELAPEIGARKAVLLPVSGAFHSPLLDESARAFADYLAGFEFRRGRCPVIANITGRQLRSPGELRYALGRQLTSPVRWVETIRSCRALGITNYLEPGPGRVLAGLVRRIDRDATVYPAGTADEITALLAE
ncbi:MAG TPA: [acyl-carrier-protein] S-malonyltransferase [candidate division WOR-3 bacterium]|uniref:Malonyl CoA-acyl carrier protein transacylase n=1 Tax=candidate division WOR-3 bacterium TaxID=2052148 RepID=A0A7V0XEG0_UNCW3|nr:[acyl-carrier-protein] S-malonyltransferase [candidate division WOR-3 bacterium]